MDVIVLILMTYKWYLRHVQGHSGVICKYICIGWFSCPCTRQPLGTGHQFLTAVLLPLRCLLYCHSSSYTMAWPQWTILDGILWQFWSQKWFIPSRKVLHLDLQVSIVVSHTLWFMDRFTKIYYSLFLEFPLYVLC